MTVTLTGVTTLLCDADGNLFPSEEPAFVASAEVTNEFLSSVGVETRFGAEQLRLATTGKNFRTTAVDLALAHGVTALPPECLQYWVDIERARVSSHLAQVLRADEAVRGPLSRLSRRYRLAAVSSSALSRLAACFTATDLDALIPAAVRFSAEDSLPTPTSKPDPAVYLHACDSLGIVPAQALAVEDSVPGVESAVAAGIRTIGNVQFVPPAEQTERIGLFFAAGAAKVVTSWTELEAVLSSEQ